MALLVVGLVVIAVNTLIGLHDQAVPEMQTFLYSHYDSDGDSSSPLFKSLVASGSIASGSIWLMIKKQLRKCMKFDLKGSMGQIDRTSSIPIQQLIFGHSRVELNNARFALSPAILRKVSTYAAADPIHAPSHLVNLSGECCSTKRPWKQSRQSSPLRITLQETWNLHPCSMRAILPFSPVNRMG